MAYFTGASLTSAAKKPFPDSFLKNALGKQDFSKGKDTKTVEATLQRNVAIGVSHRMYQHSFVLRKSLFCLYTHYVL